MIVFLPAVLTFLITVAATYLILRFERWHWRFSHDDDLRSPQKVHQNPVPRIGGLAIFLGLCAGFFTIARQTPEHARDLLYLMLASIPVFLGGLGEDLTKKISPRDRLLLAFLSATIIFYEGDIGLSRIGWAWFDHQILTLPGVSLFLTIFAISGVSHATNIIDGFNGLLLGFSLVALTLLSFVAWQLDDAFLLALFLTTIAAVFALLLFNFPRGLVFTGDGGAYLLGFLLATFALLVIKRHPTVSPWFAFLILIHPVFEVIFSIYRKRILQGASIFKADKIHIHMLIHKRVIPRFLRKSHRYQNAQTSVFVLLMGVPFLLPAFFWWNVDWVMIASAFAFCCFYVWIYFYIVRFKNRTKRKISHI